MSLKQKRWTAAAAEEEEGPGSRPMPLSAADATQYEREGYFILRNALPADLLGRLNETFDREIERHLSEADRDAGWRGTAFTRDGKYSPLVPGEVTNDNHRFRFECVNHDMPDGSRFWSPEFIRLIDLPGVIDIVTELACDGEHWGHLGARGSGQPPRLGHHNVFLRSRWGDGAPEDLGGGLHGGNGREEMEKCTISVAYELLDVDEGDGGFSCIPGSHHPGFELPTHEGWRQGYSTAEGRGPDWPQHAELRPVAPMRAGDALICESSPPLALSLPLVSASLPCPLLSVWSERLFVDRSCRRTVCCGCGCAVTEHLTHGTLPWLVNKERRTLFFKYTQHGTVRPHSPGANCAYYDLADERLTEAQRFILDGGIWGSDGLAMHHERLATLAQLQTEHSEAHAESTAKL
jgi:hypothetical protein